MKKFVIKLGPVHRASGKTLYGVAKETGIALNTVRKYALSDGVSSPYLPAVVVVLAEYYGVDWRDEAVVEVVEGEDPEIKTPSSVAA